jgi:diguanylate cyclase (GGDEF)-like protein
LGGIRLLTRDVERRINRVIMIVTFFAVVLGVVFFSGFREGTLPAVIVLFVVRMHLQGFSVRISERTDLSLGTAAVLPTIYLTGITPAMLTSVLLGIYDGVRHKKLWQRAMYNSAQFAISSLVGGLILEFSTSRPGVSGFPLLVSFVAATTAYIFTNNALVCYVVALGRGIPWWIQIKEVLGRSVFSYFCSAFLGIMFTFFVIGYGFWGLIAFSAFLVTISGLLKSAAEVSAERARRQEVEEELVIDDMTGAYNFRYLNRWLSEPSHERVALLFMDIDGFAAFNNSYGHAEGDQVLKNVVEAIQQIIRAEDRVVRYGGDEFVVFLKNMDVVGARRVAERIRERLASLEDPCWKEPITVSLGIAASPQHATDKRQLLLFADQAMYQAKQACKNTIRVWNAVNDIA